MRIILICIFIVLYLKTYEICEYFYPEDVTEWYYLRDKIHGFMFLVLILSNWTGKVVIKALVLFSSILIAASLIDKQIFNIYETVDKDYFIIIPFAIAAGYLYYMKRNK